jgi:DNA (cytosine-5)-methyltransferase 1
LLLRVYLRVWFLKCILEKCDDPNKNVMNMKNLKLIDLFAGAGGLSCGLEMAGFQPILANEILPQYAATYQKNNPKTIVLIEDIRKLCEKDFLSKNEIEPGTIDLLAGGPPCQGFSVNAPIRSLDDPRNHLFKDFLRIASLLRPKGILIENVPGIVSFGKGTVVKQIYHELTAMGYIVNHRILFAGHYGVPQMRFRTVFIAIQKSKCSHIEFPTPQYNAKAVANFTGAKELCLPILPLFHSELKPHTTVHDALTDLPEILQSEIIEKQDYITLPQNNYQKYLRKNSKHVFNHRCNKLADINIQRLKHIPQGGSWRDIPHVLLPEGLKRARRSDHTKRYGRLNPSGLCSTVLTKCDPHWGSFFHPYFDRVLSIREAARMQSFPDSYRFYGSITEQYEQVGNAVPPLLAKAIGLTIRKLIGE